MARVLGLFPAALVAARGGMSANAFYNELRSEGVAPRRAEALQLYKIARDVVAKHEQEVFRPTTGTPTPDEIAQWPTKFRTGIIQNVTVTVRDKTTGQVSAKTLSVKSDTPRTRESAIAYAVSLASENSDAYNQEIVGAVHTATYDLTPDLLES